MYKDGRRMDYRPEPKSSNYKVSRRNTGEKFCDIGVGTDFLEMTQKHKLLRMSKMSPFGKNLC